MADPKLVEALAELVAAWSQKCPIDHVETTVANDIRHDCQKFFDRHNLVQLPEEPSGWVPVTEEGAPIWGGARKHEQDAKGYGLPVHLVYTVPPLEAPDDS